MTTSAHPTSDHHIFAYDELTSLWVFRYFLNGISQTQVVKVCFFIYYIDDSARSVISAIIE